MFGENEPQKNMKQFLYTLSIIHLVLILGVKSITAQESPFGPEEKFDRHNLKNWAQLLPDSILLSEPDGDTFDKEFFDEHGWRSGRIVGGTNANIQDYPWHVALLSATGTQYCAGTILSEYWILTAAHCGTPNRIRAGVTNRTDNTGQDRFIVQKINHPDYTPYKNDISLILLQSPLDLSGPNVKAIPIITQAHAADGYTDAGVMAVITGWGALYQGGPSSNILQVAELPIVSNEDAVNLGGYNPGQITPDMLCAGYLGVGGVDACQGDSGGPLVVPDPGSPLGYSVAGVTSWGIGCAQPLYPGVWARVSYFESWIAGHTGLSWNGPITLPNPSSFTAVAQNTHTVNLNWTPNQNNNEVLLVWSDTYLIGSPAEGETYNPGDVLPGGGTVLYRGNDVSFVHEGLTPATQYYYKIWSYSPAYEYSIGKVASAITGCILFTLPFTETFEDNSGSRNCWTQIQEVGTKWWTFTTGAGGGSITTARSGVRNARFTSSSGGPWITKLVSPVINMNNWEEVTLSFWYGQQVWSGDQNHLRLYYRTSPQSPWIQIGNTYTDNISVWTQVQNIILPDPSPTYQIAFEGIDRWGYANVIDDVEITGTWTGPPAEVWLQNIEVGENDEDCFAAYVTLYVAGNNDTFEVQPGGSATLVSGSNIIIYNGTHVYEGGYLHAYIDTEGDFCTNTQAMMVAVTNSVSDPDDNFSFKPKSPAIVNDKVILFPNPANDKLTVRFPSLRDTNYRVELISLVGETISLAQTSDNIEFIYDLSGLAPGLYFVRVSSHDFSTVEKFIKR